MRCQSARCRAKREHLDRLTRLSPQSPGHNLVVTVLCVPYSFSCGSPIAVCLQTIYRCGGQSQFTRGNTLMAIANTPMENNTGSTGKRHLQYPREVSSGKFDAHTRLVTHSVCVAYNVFKPLRICGSRDPVSPGKG